MREELEAYLVAITALTAALIYILVSIGNARGQEPGAVITGPAHVVDGGQAQREGGR